MHKNEKKNVGRSGNSQRKVLLIQIVATLLIFGVWTWATYGTLKKKKKLPVGWFGSHCSSHWQF